MSIQQRAGLRRTIRGSVRSLTATAVVVALAACGQSPAGSPSPQTTTGAPTAPATSPGGSPSPTSAPTSTPTADSATGSPTPNAPATSKKPTSAPSGTAAPGSCANLAARLSLNAQIGQLFMVATSSSGMTDHQAQRFSRLKIGSVLLLGNSTAGRATITEVTRSIRRRVGTEHGVKLLLAADQEGGMVQRLAGPGFSTIPSAEQQAYLSDDQLQADARRWGRQLGEAGIDANLAPVSDVVPTSIGTANQPIGALHRGYGPDPATVARKNTAFIRGMESAGIATSVKHFPGLGIVLGNTDFSTDVTDNQTTRHDQRLAGFRAGVAAGVDMVMVSSAVYTRIDANRPATFSTTVLQGMIRSDLGFNGVIISDDLLGAALSSVPVQQRALRFVRAGGDLAIVSKVPDAADMVHALRQAAADDPRLRSEILTAATRVLAMKARHGLTGCTP